MAFENRYPVNRARLAEWARHPINRKRFLLFKTLWGVMFVLMAGYAIYSFLAFDAYMAYIGVLLALFCMYGLFLRDKVTFNKQYRIMVQAHGASEWERIITFSDKVDVRDGNSSAEYAYDQFNTLTEHGGFLALGMGNGWRALYLRLAKDGFGEKTYLDFVEFLQREHPHITFRNE